MNHLRLPPAFILALLIFAVSLITSATAVPVLARQVPDINISNGNKQGSFGAGAPINKVGTPESLAQVFGGFRISRR